MIDLEKEILSNVVKSWRKIARIVGDVLLKNQKKGINLDENLIHAEVIKLVNEGRIESQGDIHRMRFSEVRKKQDENIKNEKSKMKILRTKKMSLRIFLGR